MIRSLLDFLKQFRRKNSDFRIVTALGIVRYFIDFSSEMIMSMLPFFVVNTLGLSKKILGVIEGSSELTNHEQIYERFMNNWNAKMLCIVDVSGPIHVFHF